MPRLFFSCPTNASNTSKDAEEIPMANTMMDSILGMVTPDMKQALAARLGESPQAVQGGLGTATAATLGSLASRAGDSGFLSQITGLLSGGNGQSLLTNLPAIASSGPSGASGELVNRFLPMVFGSQQGQVASAISQQSGISASSGQGLLKMAVPLVLAYLARMHSAGTLNPTSLGSMLRAEAPSLQSYLPAGLLSSASNVVSSTAGRAASVVQSGVTTATSGAPRWLIPLAILGALLLAWLVIRSMSTPRETVTTTTPTVTNTPAPPVTTTRVAPAAWARLGEMTQVSLPDGSAITAPAQGVEARLVKALNDNTGVNSWFDFDRLLFDTNSATLQPASQEQLNNVAAILKAYPQVKVRIGGYTDNTGDPAANVQLSQQRADSVMGALTQLGVDPSRMSAKGYGQDNPVADNSTDAGRQQNRRISLQIEG
jgi:outer membrane protein OmpA-like peptidoglycan-associated protein